MKNPLLEEFNEPFGTIPFEELKTEHFVPAIDTAIDEAKAEMEAVKATPAMMTTPMADPSKNPALAAAMQPPPEEQI